MEKDPRRRDNAENRWGKGVGFFLILISTLKIFEKTWYP